jgi:hypothetical protein
VSGPDAATDQLPPLAVAINVCAGIPVALEPEYSLTVTVLESPLAVPAEPENVGVALFIVLPLAGLVNVTAGAEADDTVTLNDPIPVAPW